MLRVMIFLIFLVLPRAWMPRQKINSKTLQSIFSDNELKEMDNQIT